jgi:hypothetical protein
LVRNQHAENSFKYEERQPTVEEIRARLNLDKYKNVTLEQPKLNDNIENMEENRRRKEELVRGQKNLLKGIFSNVNTSYYQDSFK